MEDLEKDLERLDLAPPPPWVKARAMVAAENVFRRQAKRSRRWYAAVAVLAAGISIVFVGTYIANSIAPMMGESGPSFSYPPPSGADTLGADVPRLPPPRFDRPAPARETEEASRTEDETDPEKDPEDTEEKDKKEDEETPEEETPLMER